MWRNSFWQSLPMLQNSLTRIWWLFHSTSGELSSIYLLVSLTSGMITVWILSNNLKSQNFSSMIVNFNNKAYILEWGDPVLGFNPTLSPWRHSFHPCSSISLPSQSNVLIFLIGANWIHLPHDSGVTLNLREKSVLMPGLRDFSPGFC